jgi:hypothetical protein
MFLNQDLEMSAFIIAIVENTEDFTFDEENRRTYGEIELCLSDCNDKVCYYFNLSSAEQRRNSLYKIRRLAKVVNEFHEAIEQEAKLIAAHQRSKPKKSKTKSAKA